LVRRQRQFITDIMEQKTFSEEERDRISKEHLTLLKQVARMKASEESLSLPTYLKRMEIPILLFKINRLEQWRRVKDETEPAAAAKEAAPAAKEESA
jgi:hypothetical protein